MLSLLSYKKHHLADTRRKHFQHDVRVFHVLNEISDEREGRNALRHPDLDNRVRMAEELRVCHGGKTSLSRERNIQLVIASHRTERDALDAFGEKSTQDTQHK